VRHAKAEADGPSGDFSRPLRNKGIEKIRANTEILRARGYTADLIISSPAVRALQTAEIYAAESGCGISTDEILLDRLLYLPSVEEIFTSLWTVDDVYRDVFLFSHNNGLSFAAQVICSDRSILMPTSAAVRIELDISSWHELSAGSGTLADYIS